MEIKGMMGVEQLLPQLLKLEQSVIYDVEIKEHKEKRSLNANNYYWKLNGEIAKKLHTSKEEVHMMMLKHYGEFITISVVSNADITPLYKYNECFGESELNGKMFKHYHIYQETHTYNTKQMARFLDGVVYEAQELGIETATPNEIERLKSLWNTKQA